MHAPAFLHRRHAGCLTSPSRSLPRCLPACPGNPDPAALAADDAIAALPAIAGYAAALALFRRLAARPDLRRVMRLYATAATAFVARGNLPMAHEAMRAMVAAFAEAGRLREAADMVLEMRSHGLPLPVETYSSMIAEYFKALFGDLWIGVE